MLTDETIGDRVQVNKIKEINCQHTRKRATGRHTGAYARCIRQVLVAREVCKIVAEMYVLPFINPLCLVFHKSQNNWSSRELKSDFIKQLFDNIAGEDKISTNKSIIANILHM